MLLDAAEGRLVIAGPDPVCDLRRRQMASDSGRWRLLIVLGLRIVVVVELQRFEWRWRRLGRWRFGLELLTPRHGWCGYPSTRNRDYGPQDNLSSHRMSRPPRTSCATGFFSGWRRPL